MADLNTKKINFTAAQVEKAVNFALTQVAEPFSTEATYAVDDYVTYDGFLYQCITAITEAGAWDSTKWQIQKIFDNNGYVIIKGGGAPVPQMPVKGQLINMTLGNGTPAAGTNNLYRVLSINGTVAEVLAMYDAAKNPYNSSGTNTYSGAELDIALNTNFYNSLSVEAKAAIIAKNIVSYEYSYITRSETHASSADYSTKTQHEAIGNRYVYALDIEDIETYFNNTFSTSDLYKLFWDTTLYPSTGAFIWLRSTINGGIDGAYFMNYSDGYIGGSRAQSLVTHQFNARPVFQIDLSKISWS